MINDYMMLKYKMPSSFSITNIPSHPCKLKDLKNGHQLVSTLRCCLDFKELLGAFCKLSNISVKKGL